MKNVDFAIVFVCTQKLGRCYTKTNLLVYTIDDINNKWYTENQRQQKLAAIKGILPTGNSGNGKLGPFELHNETMFGRPMWIANYSYEVDSGD